MTVGGVFPSASNLCGTCLNMRHDSIAVREGLVHNYLDNNFSVSMMSESKKRHVEAVELKVTTPEKWTVIDIGSDTHQK